MPSMRDEQVSQRPRKQRVQDDKGGVYELGKRISEGGQGIVCPTQNPRFLVKVSKYPDSDPRAQAWRKQIAAVHRMPIRENDLPIAMPVALIVKPRAGYVMELMEGLISLEEVLNATHAAGTPDESAAIFQNSGGLARRLCLLARFARVMAKLHGIGIAHGDLSPNNVFVSSSIEHAQVWLIDCDNLSYAVRDSSLQIYTPDYGAPEIFRGELGISTYTDIWSFAVISFQLLTLLHPFKNGELVDSDSDLEDAASRGEIPWIDHASDDSNRGLNGIPRAAVLTPRLSELFEKCFNEGLLVPEQRPVMAEWAEAFEAAAAAQVICDVSQDGCGSTFFWGKDLVCPFCDVAQECHSTVRLEHRIFAPSHELMEDATPADKWIATGHHQVIGTQPTTLRSSPPGTASHMESDVIATLWVDAGELVIEEAKGAALQLQTAGVKRLAPIRRRVILQKKGIRLAIHAGPVDQLHNVWLFSW